MKLHDVEGCLLGVQKIDIYESISVIIIKHYIPLENCVSGMKIQKKDALLSKYMKDLVILGA